MRPVRRKAAFSTHIVALHPYKPSNKALPGHAIRIFAAATINGAGEQPFLFPLELSCSFFFLGFGSSLCSSICIVAVRSFVCSVA